MRVETVTHRRIGAMGYPTAVWMVWEAVPGTTPFAVAFYERERAAAWAAAAPHRHLKAAPTQIKDACAS
jgi:hypothetical protein